MNFISETIHFEFNRRTYWTRITVKSDSGKQSTILVCALQNFISDHYRISAAAAQNDAEKFFREIVFPDTEREFGESDLNQKVYYKIYAATPEGQKNGLEFLQQEVTP